MGCKNNHKLANLQPSRLIDNMTKIFLSILSLLFIANNTFAQSEVSFKKHISELCSEKMHGRGAEFNGDGIAAKYLENEFRKNDLKTIKGSYKQNFNYSVNTFEGEYELKINGTPLKAGDDFIVHAASKPGKGSFKTFRLTKENWNDEAFRIKFLKKHWVNKVIIYDHELNDPKTKDYFKLKLAKLQAAALIEVLESDPIANEFSGQLQAPTFQVSAKKLAEYGEIKKVDFNLDATLKENYASQNVYGLIKGDSLPDEYIVISAHYDHIGHLGKATMLQGANDNATGVAMLLSLAEYFSKPENTPSKSILFIAFAAEEIGLIGSEYYVNHPVVDLEKTKFVLNLDLLGSGSEGIMVVNGEELDLEYQLLKTINETGLFVSSIERRKNRANSDHFHFTEKNIPAFFIYAKGKVGGYHNLGDTKDKLENGQFDGLFKLFKEFVNSL